MGVIVPEIAGRFCDAADAAERLLLLRVCVTSPGGGARKVRSHVGEERGARCEWGNKEECRCERRTETCLGNNENHLNSF